MAKAAANKIASLSAAKCAALGLIGVAGLLISAIGPFKVPFAESLAKTYYRQAVMGLALAVLVIGGVITAVVELFDPNQFKDQLVQWVRERTQRDLVLDGALKMSYFPRLGIESGRASLSQRRSAREFASIERAQVTLAWLPLLRGQMRIHSAELEGLRAQIVRFKDGSSNVDDLARDLAAVDAAQVELDSLRISRAALQWNDELMWQRGSVAELQLELGHVADGVSGPLSVSGRIDAPVAGIDARVQLKGRLLFDAAAGRVELARIDAQLDGRALGIDNLGASLKGDVTALPRERALDAQSLALASTHRSGLSVIHTALVLPELKLGEYKWVGTALQFDASLTHPDRAAALTLKVPRFEWADRALRETTAQAQLLLKGGGAQLRAQGSSPLALTLDGGPRIGLAALELSAHLSHPALTAEAQAKLNGHLDVDWKRKAAQSAWRGTLAGHDVEGGVAVVDEGGRARWTVNADLARLDVDALLSAPWLTRLGDDTTPFDVSMLRDVRALGTVRVGQLALGGAQISSAVARFDLDQSVLAVEPFVAQLYGAQLDAALKVDAAAPAPLVSLRGSAADLDLRALLADVAPTPWLEGRGTIGWDLSASGASVGSLRHALAGSVHATVKGGMLAGVNLRGALLEGQSELGRGGTATTAREFNAQVSTPFSELNLQALLKEGRAHAQSLELQSGAVRTGGEGELALDTGMLDLRLQTVVGAKPATDLAPLAGVTVPLRVLGPWRAPRLAFDYGAAIGDKLPRPSDAAPAPQAGVEREVSPEGVPVALSVK